MCGISVLLSNDRYKNQAFIERANVLQKHRGPDDSGVYQTKSVWGTDVYQF